MGDAVAAAPPTAAGDGSDQPPPAPTAQQAQARQLRGDADLEPTEVEMSKLLENNLIKRMGPNDMRRSVCLCALHCCVCLKGRVPAGGDGKKLPDFSTTSASACTSTCWRLFPCLIWTASTRILGSPRRPWSLLSAGEMAFNLMCAGSRCLLPRHYNLHLATPSTHSDSLLAEACLSRLFHCYPVRKLRGATDRTGTLGGDEINLLDVACTLRYLKRTVNPPNLKRTVNCTACMKISKSTFRPRWCIISRCTMQLAKVW